MCSPQCSLMAFVSVLTFRQHSKAGNNRIGVKREELVGKGVTESIYLKIYYNEEIKEAFKNI